MKVLALILMSVGAFASSVPEKPSAWVASLAIRQTAIRSKVEQLGLGAQVKLKVLHRGHYHGYITGFTDRSIEVTDSKTLRARSFEFSTIERLEGRPLPDPSDRTGNQILRRVFRATSQLGFGP